MSTPRPDHETLRGVIALATRAPSVHNTQPWRWLIGDTSVHLFADWTRHLPATDPDGRDLLISCGAALHHLRVALAAFGWATTIHRIPNPDDPTHLAAIEMHQQEPSEDDVAQAAAITHRRTDRRRMSSWPVPHGHLDLLVERARNAGTLLTPVTDPGARFLLAGAIAEAAVLQEHDPTYNLELSAWSGRSRSADDGVLAAGTPPAVAATTGDVRMRTFPGGTLAQPPVEAGHEERSELLVLATSGDELLSRLRAGEATSAALLTATELGLASCPLSQALEISDTRRKIRDGVLNGSATPQLIIRVGWAAVSAEHIPPCPRRPLDEVLGFLPGTTCGRNGR
jgi:nitroreductase